MVTDMTVHDVGSYIAEDRSWYIGEHGANVDINVPLDFTTFTGANFADGLVKSGCVLGKITATGKYGPYDPAATDGRNTAACHLHSSFKVPANTATVASAAGVVHANVKVPRLPYASGAGALDAAVRTALRNVHYID